MKVFVQESVPVNQMWQELAAEHFLRRYWSLHRILLKIVGYTNSGKKSQATWRLWSRKIEKTFYQYTSNRRNAFRNVIFTSEAWIRQIGNLTFVRKIKQLILELRINENFNRPDYCMKHNHLFHNKKVWIVCRVTKKN